MDEKITLNGIDYVRADSIKEKKSKPEFEEREFYLTDPANCMAMGKIFNLDKNPRCMSLDFEDNKDISLWKKEGDEDTVKVFKGKEQWASISSEYYNKAKELIKSWNSEEIEVFIQKEKDRPVLIAGGNLGFVIAPRIESE